MGYEFKFFYNEVGHFSIFSARKKAHTNNGGTAGREWTGTEWEGMERGTFTNSGGKQRECARQKRTNLLLQYRRRAAKLAGLPKATATSSKSLTGGTNQRRNEGEGEEEAPALNGKLDSGFVFVTSSVMLFHGSANTESMAAA